VQYCEGDTSAMLIAPNGFQSYQWSDGVGIVGTDDTLVIYNPTPGQQNYSCTITSVTGCQATLSVMIDPIIPLAGFLGDYVCDHTIDFTDTTLVYQDVINNWSWDFGDGNQSTAQNPSHVYLDSGWYNVTLQVQSSVGCRDTVVIPVYIKNNPIADFSVPDTCSLQLAFTDLSSSFNGNQLVNWDWDFDDGNQAVIQNPNHTYAAIGTFNVILTVTDNDGCTDTITQPVIVRSTPSADFSFLNDCVYNAIDFADQSTVQLSTISTWQWDFGNNQQSNQQNPSNQYLQSGNYDVQLIVSTQQGCTDTITQSVTVYAQPNVAFSSNDVCHGHSTLFTNQSTAPNGATLVSYDWYFGDPTIPNSSQTDPIAYYQQTGSYNVRLIVQTDQGCYDTLIQSVSVWPVPDVNFTADPLTGCYPHAPQFDNLTTISSGNVAYYVWNYGDNTTETVFENTHLYPNSAGTYSVSLTAVSEKGCDTTLTFSNYITVYPSPD
ncbi:MAG: PKD domain-containing protein, partial [Flavobacteriales bacterium]|nr:PKD domain-containing protein [Flavobacteriales bacterium]